MDKAINFITPKHQTTTFLYNYTIRQALEKFDVHKFSVVPVLDDDGHYITTISEGDILRFIKRECNFDIKAAEQTKIYEIETYHPYKSLKVDASFKEILKLSLDQNFIPLVDDRNIFIGIIKRKQIIEAYYKQHEE